MRSAVVLCLLIITAGCLIPSNPGYDTELSFSGSMETTDSGFEMTGNLAQIGGTRSTLMNVSICGYGKQGNLIFAEPVAPFTSTATVELHVNQTPYYIVIYSDEFWGRWGGKVDAVQYYEDRGDGVYSPSWADAKSDLPIDTDEPKQSGCPS